MYGSGGNGARGNTATVGANDTSNRGNGGGGGGFSSGGARNGGTGGSGIVIIRYSDALGNTATGTGTITTSPGYIIHTFTGTGTFSTNNDFGINYSIN